MDYLDPRKQFQHKLILLVGYVFVTIAIVGGSLVLLYQSYGFGLGKNGKVIQNGLVFISSQPNPAKIYFNGVLNNNSTNARLVLPAGIYQLRLSRAGYRDWQRTIGVDGGSVTHFDYPLLVPQKLISNKEHGYDTAPALATQSPDRRWLLVLQPGSDTVFDEFDLRNPKNVPASSLTLPSSIVTKPAGSESWQEVSWADDNQHALLQHLYDGKSEFILLDRQNPDQSLNLNSTFGINPTKLTLNNKKYNQYYFYDAAAATLQTGNLSTPSATPLLDRVLAYQSYGSNTVLYVTDHDAPAGKVLVKMAIGNQTYIVHTFPAGGSYTLDLTEYSGTMYVVAGDSAENKVYIFKDPVGQLNNNPSQAVTPIQVLHVTSPDYVSFSDNAQFIVAEHGQQFGVYDIEYKNGYNYTAGPAIDAPQTHASWMDGDRLTYVSNGKLSEADYDNTNRQTLMALSPNYQPFFAPDYRYAYAVSPDGTGGQFQLAQTSLLIPADQ